jgi:hypothetical protein
MANAGSLWYLSGTGCIPAGGAHASALHLQVYGIYRAQAAFRLRLFFDNSPLKAG